MTMHAKRYQNSAALLIIMRCTNTFEPVEPAEPLSQIIKGQHAPWANPEPRTLNPFSLAYFSSSFYNERNSMMYPTVFQGGV